MPKHLVSVAAIFIALLAVSFLPLRASAAVPVGARSSAKTPQPAAARRRAELARAIEDFQRRVADLADEEASIADEVASLGDLPEAERDRLMGRKHEMDLQVGDLERDLDSTSAEFRRDGGDASRALQDAANDIRQSKLKEKLRYSRGIVQASKSGNPESMRLGAPEAAREFEEKIGADILDLEQHLADAAEAVVESVTLPLE